MDMTSQLERAIRLHQSGKLDLAENHYEAILEASNSRRETKTRRNR